MLGEASAGEVASKIPGASTLRSGLSTHVEAALIASEDHLVVHLVERAKCGWRSIDPTTKAAMEW
jgi:hypothetical protein